MPISERDLEYLSSAVDGRLTIGERAALETRLASDAELRRELESLRATISLLKTAERVRVPRNFTLDPKKYGRPVQPSLWQRWGLAALTPLASAGAALAVVMIVGGGLLLTASLRSPQAEISAPEAAVGGQAQAPQPLPAAAMTEAPTGAATESSVLAAGAPTSSAADAAFAPPAATPAAVAGASGPNTSGGAGGGLPPTYSAGLAPSPTQAMIIQAPVEGNNNPRYGGGSTSATLTDQGGAESTPATTDKSGAGSAGVPAEQPPAESPPGQSAADARPVDQFTAALPVLQLIGGGLALGGVGLLIAIFVRRRA